MTDGKEYCGEMQAAFAEWKEELCNVMSAVDACPEDEKSRLGDQIASLHDLVEDMTWKMDRMQRLCPAGRAA